MKIKPLEILFSPEETRIRTDWKQSLCIVILGCASVSFVTFIFIALWGTMEDAFKNLFKNLVQDLSLAFSLTLLYFFAYKKLGTKWILAVLLLSPIKMLAVLINELHDFLNMPDLTASVIFFSVACELFSLALFVFLWIHCKRLYQLNRAIKKRNAQIQLEQMPSA